jgi:small subunit ribosomal protein S1
MAKTKVSDGVSPKGAKTAFAKYLDSSAGDLKIYQSGDLVAGEVTAVTKNRIWIDIDDGRFIGIISNKELAEEGISAPDYKAGDRVTASVLMPENDEGFMILSLRDALENQGWTALEERRGKDEVFDVKVVEANRGGLIVEADGLRGFLPVSQLAPEHYPRVGNDKDEILNRLAKFEGEMMQVKVLDLDKSTSKLIFSEKIARKGEFDELVSDIKVNDVLEGSVSGVVDFGIFVSLGQLEGLVHISEISWGKVDHPSNFAQVGDKVRVQVIAIDADKISLSMKRLEADPWLTTIKNFQIGQEVTGRVTQIMPFGVFVSIDGKVDGLIHISELSHEHVVDPSAVVKVDDKLKLKVIDLGAESHRLGLSLKAMQKPAVVEKTEGSVVANDDETSDLVALGLTSAMIKKLNTAGITKRADLQGKTKEELIALPAIGKATADKIILAMEKQ